MKSNANKATKWKRVMIVGVLAFAALIVTLETQKSVPAEGAQTTFQSPAEPAPRWSRQRRATMSRLIADLGPDAKVILSGRHGSG